jgi:cellulose synthase/poly-beta-1,6-N-acetylglucosamine synthase-like glycosyltransferase
VLTWDTPTAVFAVFVLVWFVQLFYYLRYFRRLAFYRPINKKGYPGPVSVVICARNEYHNLVRNLPLILKQDYHDFEVVVVDDASDDDTAQLLQQLQNQHAHFESDQP